MKEWTTDTHNNMEESRNNYSEWKKPEKNKIAIIQNAQKCKLIYTDRSNGCLRVAEEHKEIFASDNYTHELDFADGFTDT